jgi:alginate O-acetyltransferase complex protein AlgI
MPFWAILSIGISPGLSRTSIPNGVPLCMVFSSAAFIFFFLPAVFIGFIIAQRFQSRLVVLYWLIASSLFFYGWWNPRYLILIAVLLAANFGASRAIVAAGSSSARSFWLAVGLAVNLSALLYYKYMNFFIQVGNSIVGSHLYVAAIVLPLGISFFTFQKIALLVDSYYGRVKRLQFAEYCLFVLFFPQLIAGPIVHHAEVVPQFQRLHEKRVNWNQVALGLSVFFIGLFKKVVFADSLAAEDVSPVFTAMAAGAAPMFLEAWTGVLGYTFQMYFDFSGYSDMAIGAALLFGIRLPQNFNSPFKAANIVEFWRRWHITLTRFLTAYIYYPLSFWLTRRRLAKGLTDVGGQHTSVGAFVNLLMFPTMTTMFLSGLWHGAGYTFIIWGLLHGAYLTIYHAWRIFVQRKITQKARYERFARPAGIALTFLCVVIAMAVFRAGSVGEALVLLKTLFGGSGIQLPDTFASSFGGLALGGCCAFLPRNGAYGHIHGGWHLIGLAALFIWCLALPNAQQIFKHFDTALLSSQSKDEASAVKIEFEFNWKWVTFMSTVVLVGLLYVQTNIAQEFLYFDF